VVSLIAMLAGGYFGLKQFYPTDHPPASITLQQLELPDIDKNIRSGEEWLGQVVVVNHWATWCPPCRAEIPDFQLFHQQYGDQGVKVIGVALDDEGLKVVKPFAEEMNMTYLNLIDASHIAARSFGGITAVPTTFIVDADGMVYKKHIGFMSYDDLKSAVLPLLVQ